MSGLLGIIDKTCKKYTDYLRQAFLIQILTKHSFKSKNRIRNPKAHIVDPGFQNNRENSMAGENIGWRLENVVYIEILRRCAYDFRDVYYYKANPRAKEVDFVVCDNITLIAFSPTRDIVLDGKTIHVVSAIDWLLS